MTEIELAERFTYCGECSPADLGTVVCTPVNWLAKYDLDLANHGPWWDRYVSAVYFTLISLSTVGFGDISPANTIERSASIIFTLMGAILFAIVLGSVSEMAQQVLMIVCVCV